MRLALLTLLAAPLLAVAQTTLSIDAGAAKAKSSPMLYGLMTEEINGSYDGGLYAELVRNRTPRAGFDGAAHWGLRLEGQARASMEVDKAAGPSAAIGQSLKLQVAAASAESPAGVENEGYWGIPLRPGTAYKASFYAKAAKPGTTVTVTLLDDDTGKPIVEKTVTGIGADWKQFSTELPTPANLQTGSRRHLVLSLTEPGTLWLTLVSLFPPTFHNRPNGNRPDLMEGLAAMHPAFLRLPGGNYLEGDHIADRYPWKQTIGPLVDRPGHPSPWQYRSSDGLGFLEFLEWTEDLGIEPVLAVYAGYSLKGEHVEPGPALQPFVQDALDEIEYVTGGPETHWGAERAKNGHPAPFPLHYVEIGNEDEFDKSGSYDGRYAQFYDAIKQRYQNLQLIATTPVKGHPVEVLDDHFYRSTGEMYADTDHYDKTPRGGTKIFVGEWATREGVPTPNFGAALADAAWMTGMERNSDVVVLSSYAPLLTNVNPGGLQWDTDLIGYDALTSYGSPSYWAQVMFANHHGDEILSARMAGNTLRMYQSTTRDSRTGTVYIKLVNATTDPAPLAVRLDGRKASGNARVFTLSAPSTEATNSIADPVRIVPKEHAVTPIGAGLDLVLEPLSINVIELRE